MDQDNSYAIIATELISPSPLNPRKGFPEKKFNELVASIKEKGVIQPIIIRPVKGKETPYEIVVGERRYRATIRAGLGGIPAIMRQLTDEEAYDFMLVENLQRDDLTDREEAESFKAYIDRHGDDGLKDLAEKTGINPGYIRSRIRVLELPKEVIKAWDKGELAFGHLQQLLRIQDPEVFEEAVDWLFFDWNDNPSVKALAEHITEEAPPISAAFFKTKEICSACTSNTLVQRDLFDIEAKKAHCLKPTCFKQHQAEWLTEHWKETETAKKEKTNGFRFAEDVNYGDVEYFHTWGYQPKKKCYECPDFISIIEITGQPSRQFCIVSSLATKKSLPNDRFCAGDKACYGAVTSPRTEKEKKTGERDPATPRAAWHGEYFRDIFLSRRIQEVLVDIDPDDPRIKELLLACAMHNHIDIVGDVLAETFQPPPDEDDFDEFIEWGPTTWILERKKKEIQGAYKKVIEAIILAGGHIGEEPWDGSFGTKGRQTVAEYLGIDLAKEFTVDQEYLEKKTKAELIAFGEKYGLLDHIDFPKVKPGKLKKAHLIERIMAHGDDLIGKVPEEILKHDRKN